MTREERRAKLHSMLLEEFNLTDEESGAILDMLLGTLEPSPSDRPTAKALLSSPIFSWLEEDGAEADGAVPEFSDSTVNPSAAETGPPTSTLPTAAPMGIGKTSHAVQGLPSPGHAGLLDDVGDSHAESSLPAADQMSPTGSGNYPLTPPESTGPLTPPNTAGLVKKRKADTKVENGSPKRAYREHSAVGAETTGGWSSRQGEPSAKKHRSSHRRSHSI